MINRVKYIWSLIKIAYAHSKLIILCPIFSCIAIFSELIAMIVIVPLSELAMSAKLNSNDHVVKMFISFDLNPSMKNLFFCMIIFLSFRLVALSANQGFTVYLGKKFHAYVSSVSFFNVINYVPLSEIRKKSIGHYMSLAGDEAFKVSEILVSVNKLITIVILGSFYFLAIAYLSFTFSVCLVLFLIFSGLLMMGAFKASSRLGHLKFDQAKKASSILMDGFNGLATVRSFSAESYISNAYANNISSYTSTLFKIDYLNTLIKFIPIAIVLLSLSIYFLTPYSDLIEGSDINFPIFITLTLFVMRFLPVIAQLINIFIHI